MFRGCCEERRRRGTAVLAECMLVCTSSVLNIKVMIVGNYNSTLGGYGVELVACNLLL